jgi:GcrA cell cycle regulator
MTSLNTPWTDERIETLKALYDERLTASQIAKRLGGTTRNSVIGKCHRLGLTGKTYERPVRTTRPQRIRETDRRAALTLASPECDAEPEATEPDTPFEPGTGRGPAAAVETLHPEQCRFPIGDPVLEPADFHFCTRRKDGQSPYCAAHHKTCLTPGKPLQPRHKGAQGPVNFARAG